MNDVNVNKFNLSLSLCLPHICLCVCEFFSAIGHIGRLLFSSSAIACQPTSIAHGQHCSPYAPANRAAAVWLLAIYYITIIHISQKLYLPNGVIYVCCVLIRRDALSMGTKAIQSIMCIIWWWCAYTLLHT